jgi:hypothetical protein
MAALQASGRRMPARFKGFGMTMRDAAYAARPLHAVSITRYVRTHEMRFIEAANLESQRFGIELDTTAACNAF